MINNILTIDLEEWFHASLIDHIPLDQNNRQLHRLLHNTNQLLQMLSQHQIKATFFVLGWVAEYYPELLQKISLEGHEIASHGYGHKLVYTLSEAEFEEDLQKANHYIEQACGVKPIGYRSPSWSVNQTTPWFFKVLENNGFFYDSSVFPVKNFLYGLPNSPRFAFSTGSAEHPLIEVPASTVKIAGMNLPFAGGFYFRALPYPIVKQCYRSINRQEKPVVFYIHPYDLDGGEPIKQQLNLRDRIIMFYGRKQCSHKMHKLLQDFNFTRMDEYVEQLRSSSKQQPLPAAPNLLYPTEKTS